MNLPAKFACLGLFFLTLGCGFHNIYSEGNYSEGNYSEGNLASMQQSQDLDKASKMAFVPKFTIPNPEISREVQIASQGFFDEYDKFFLGKNSGKPHKDFTINISATTGRSSVSIKKNRVVGRYNAIASLKYEILTPKDAKKAEDAETGQAAGKICDNGIMVGVISDEAGFFKSQSPFATEISTREIQEGILRKLGHDLFFESFFKLQACGYI